MSTIIILISRFFVGGVARLRWAFVIEWRLLLLLTSEHHLVGSMLSAVKYGSLRVILPFSYMLVPVLSGSYLCLLRLRLQLCCSTLYYCLLVGIVCQGWCQTLIARTYFRRRWVVARGAVQENLVCYCRLSRELQWGEIELLLIISWFHLISNLLSVKLLIIIFYVKSMITYFFKVWFYLAN